ncbi:MAG: DUF4340 domain-containing protein, partial [Magnetococcales bacterium]|nr:DUF4340 domain-containing protein [Magnetococcales bacterium]
MSKGWLTNLVLLAVVAAGAGGLWWAERQTKADKQREEAARDFTGFKVTDLVKARLTRSGQEPIVLEKGADGWRITAPTACLTDSDAVEGLLKVVEGRYDRKVAETTPNLADFGLDKPGAILEVTTGASQTATLITGSDTPASINRYLRLGPEGPVVTAPRYELSLLERGRNDLRAKALGAALDRKAEVVRMEVIKGGNRLAVAMDDQGFWRLEAPLADLASPRRVRYWIGDLKDSLASGFKDASPPADPDWRVILTPRGGSPLELPVWWQDKDLLARRPGDPDALVLDAMTVNRLDKNPLEMVALDPLPPGLQVAGLKIERDGAAVQTVKTASPARPEDQIDAETQSARDWPNPAWATVAEVLTREAASAELARARGLPDLVVAVTGKAAGDQGAAPAPLAYALWKDGDSYLLAPPGRPVHLRLTRFQTDSLD